MHGSAGYYEKEGDRYHIHIEQGNLSDPLALGAVIAHELGHVHLLGHGRIGEDEEDHESLTDLLTVFMGMGLFTANSVVRSASWTVGPMSMFQISRLGYLTMPMFGYAFARFARERGEENPGWGKYLRLDVRHSFRKSMKFLKNEIY